jgi:DNA-binding NtrC family response regulator
VKDSLYYNDPYPGDKGANDSVRKALIVDDESDICYLLSSILKQVNIQPVFAGTISEAEQALNSSQSFCYVFLDNHLPDGFGINHIKKWKEHYPSIHLIMITAQDSDNERQTATTEGADHFISKPFSKETILNTVVQTLC